VGFLAPVAAVKMSQAHAQEILAAVIWPVVVVVNLRSERASEPQPAESW
jgi:hypothetical protein